MNTPLIKVPPRAVVTQGPSFNDALRFVMCVALGHWYKNDGFAQFCGRCGAFLP